MEPKINILQGNNKILHTVLGNLQKNALVSSIKNKLIIIKNNCFILGAFLLEFLKKKNNLNTAIQSDNIALLTCFQCLLKSILLQK